MCCELCPYSDECEELDEVQDECCPECPDFEDCQSREGGGEAREAMEDEPVV